MVGIEILEGIPPDKGHGDLLDIRGRVQVFINDSPLPGEYFPDGIEINLYETAFEFIELINRLMSFFREKPAGGAAYSAEFCYSGNFMVAKPKLGDGIDVFIRFNPVLVDDVRLLDEEYNVETTGFADFAIEVINFAISVADTLHSVKGVNEEDLDELNGAIIACQESLEKDFGFILPEETE